jgi:hypothetical protein
MKMTRSTRLLHPNLLSNFCQMLECVSNRSDPGQFGYSQKMTTKRSARSEKYIHRITVMDKWIDQRIQQVHRLCLPFWSTLTWPTNGIECIQQMNQNVEEETRKRRRTCLADDAFAFNLANMMLKSEQKSCTGNQDLLRRCWPSPIQPQTQTQTHTDTHTKHTKHTHTKHTHTKHTHTKHTH